MFFSEYNIWRYFPNAYVVWFDIGVNITILMQKLKCLQNLDPKVKSKKLRLVLRHVVILKKIIDGLSSVLHLNFSQFISHFYR